MSSAGAVHRKAPTTALAAANFGAPITGFEFRCHSPAFDGTVLHVCGEAGESGAKLWTEQGGVRNMVATATTG